MESRLLKEIGLKEIGLKEILNAQIYRARYVNFWELLTPSLAPGAPSPHIFLLHMPILNETLWFAFRAPLL